MDWLVKSKKANYQGNYNFQLVLSEDDIDSSSTISIMAFTDSSQKAVVPCSYTWFIIKNGVPQEIPDFRGSSFICETSHIGYLVQAHITSNDMQYPGKAIVTLGPVQLDVSLKTDILGSLSQGYSNQAVYVISQENEQRECTIQIYEDKVRIMHAFSDLSYTFDYSMMEPLFSHHPKDINHVTVAFNQKYQRDLKKFQKHLFGKEEHSMTRSSIRNNSTSSNEALKLGLRFMTRANRDVFLYTLKGFITRRELKNTAVIRKIEKINFENNEEFSSILLVNQLRRDLVRYDRAYKKLAGERKRLEEQGFGSPQTIKSSTMIRRQEPPLAGKVIQLQRQNQLLNGRIRALMQEINNIKLVSPPPPPSSISNFKKKRDHEEHTISHLLEDLNRSEQMIHFDAENQLTIERLQSQKRVMQMNLDSANQKIAYLEKRGANISFGSMTVEKEFYNRMTTENEDLKRANDRLQRQIRLSKESIQQLRLQTERSPSKSSSNSYLQRQLDDVKSRLSFCEHELEQTTKAKQIIEQKCINLARKVNDYQNQIEMYKRNQDVMNRSQTLSDQMFDYNEEQVKLLKEHNEFLVTENQKLAKACEKYMSEAKQAIKLRQEILQLRQKLSKAYTNPQNQSFTA